MIRLETSLARASVLVLDKKAFYSRQTPRGILTPTFYSYLTMLKLLLASLVTLLSVTSAFVTPSSSTSISSRSVTPAAVAAVKVPTSLFVSTTSSNDLPTTHLAVAATASVMMTLLAPLAVFAEEAGDYEYGAVAAPGGIGLAVGLGVLAVSSLYNSLFFHGGGACFSCFDQYLTFPFFSY